MNTKEAIEFMGMYRDSLVQEGILLNNSLTFEKLTDIITLLQQDEKYRQMWEELEVYFRRQELMRIVGKMHSIEQKYFPNFQKTIIIKIRSTDEAKLKNWIGWFQDNNCLKCDENNIDYKIKIKERD